MGPYRTFTYLRQEDALQLALPATLWFIRVGRLRDGGMQTKGVAEAYAARLWFIRGKDMVKVPRTTDTYQRNIASIW
jgi:hypothetical protein